MLTERQAEIAALVATGASNKEIARELSISIKTVKNTLTAVFEKTGARSRTDLALQIVRGTGPTRIRRSTLVGDFTNRNGCADRSFEFDSSYLYQSRRIK